MSISKRVWEEKEYIENVARQLLQETKYLEACEFHETLLVVGDDEQLQQAYKLANARVTSGDIDLSYGFTRRDLTDAIKNAAEEAGEECYSCQRIREE